MSQPAPTPTPAPAPAGRPRRPFPGTVLRWLRPRSFLEIGVLRAALLALPLTALFFGAINAWLCRAIDRAYATAQAAELDRARDGEEAAALAIELGWADRQLRDWLTAVLVPPARSAPAHERYLAMFDRVASSSAGAEKRPELLRRLVTGQRGGWAGFAIGTRPTSGAELFAMLAGADEGQWLTLLNSSSYPEEKKAFLIRYGDALLAGVAPEIRALRRFNGAVQWATVFLTFLIFVIIFRRWLLLRQQRALLADRGRFLTDVIPRDWGPLAQCYHQLSTRGPGAISNVGLLHQEVARVSDSVDRDIHVSIGVLVGFLPSLGFIGTILGMGDALMKADLLFGSQDRQQAISLMTQDLGYAFDTTLVALVCGLAAGLLLAYLRLKEKRYFAQVGEAAAEKLANALVRKGGVP